MAYRARPRFQAETLRPRRADERHLADAAPAAARRWETTQVLDALNEMHNAPHRQPRRERERDA
jgi:hypothetical protein